MSYIPVKDYTVVNAWDISELEKRVNSKLEEGYMLVGGVTFTNTTVRTTSSQYANTSVRTTTLQYCQALVKRGNP